MKYSEKLNNVKWILTLLIVLYHIPNVISAGGNDIKFLFIQSFADCVVPAFSLISGFLFYRYVDSYKVIKEKMKRRIKTLLLPYLAWNFIHMSILKFSRVYPGGVLT